MKTKINQKATHLLQIGQRRKQRAKKYPSRNFAPIISFPETPHFSPSRIFGDSLPNDAGLSASNFGSCCRAEMNRRHVGLHVGILAIPAVLSALFWRASLFRGNGGAAHVEVFLRSPSR